MKTIYCAITPAPFGQSIDATLVAQDGGLRFKVTVHYDTSYRDQTLATVEVLDGLAFRPLLHLRHHELTVSGAYAADRRLLAKPEVLSDAIVDELDRLAHLGKAVVS